MTQTKFNLVKKIHSLISLERFQNARLSVETVIADKIPGCVVECGTYKGGCLAGMADVAFPHDINVWGFDTYEGLPAASIDKDGDRAVKKQGTLAASIDDVKQAFKVLGQDPESTHLYLIKGLFQDTLAQYKTQMGPIAVLRLDGDWYDSTKCCLDELYDQVSIGGFIIIDDYGHWAGCAAAVNDFRKEKNIIDPMITVDYTERFWRKSA